MMSADGRATRVHPRLRRPVAILGATRAPAMIWFVAVPITGLRLRVPGRVGQPTLEIGLPPVLAVALFASLAGWGLLALLERLTRRARGVWSVLALAVLLLSFAMLTGPGIAPVTRLVLGLMHVAVATVLIPSLWKAPTKVRT